MMVHIANKGHILWLSTFMIFLCWTLDFSQISPVFYYCPFSVIRSNLGYHVLFNCHISLVFSGLCQLQSTFLFFMTLKILSSGQLFFKLSLTLGFFHIFPMIRLELWVWKKNFRHKELFSAHDIREYTILTTWLITSHINLVILLKITLLWSYYFSLF